MILNLVPTIMKRFNENDETSNNGTSDLEHSFYDIDGTDPDMTKLNILCQAIMNPPSFPTLHEFHTLILGCGQLDASHANLAQTSEIAAASGH
eukprot:CAMPEP_0194368844 /NCGR_PEP_ID=MMETSP0174-20130528/17081_1 /TAXON_ID=216777 /ORGANISM="Proboscia alata, Strain PI-D3" /LENGTH=92 /DNA_ID=CAMNT_0039145417 /DNA_START=147 /DNA_END=422 /DNA_ORIENTATION=+